MQVFQALKRVNVRTRLTGVFFWMGNDGTASAEARESRWVDTGQAGSFVTSFCKSGYNAASALTRVLEQRQGACTQTPKAFCLTDLVCAKDSQRRRTSMSLAS
ncbi:hypothetical protein EIG75_19015 [Pseudomonas syringae]|uniref:Uncharacterized protein n=1 Tax=Pseudomonas syringae TaxID=317 RepID=A0A6B2BDJ6_PSESX|nr:hypothetical protein [Pseudomonas syringae]NAO44317.1 hypothetical protein [Pseudomonas syringae]NAO49081.1 hypothetical protein [Pseudomonas syringae]NAO62833.1 hypothetical protein [Pseudomonas syringae]NAO67909.1 hypothetical protein [Pseudomonas syringae]